MEKEIPLHIKKRLLKKWRCILTKYSKLRDNGFIKVTKKGNLTRTTYYHLVKDFYLKEIEKAEKMIEKLT